MRWIIRLAILLVIIVALEVYAFQALKTVSKNKIVRYSWVIVSVIVYVNFTYVAITYDRTLVKLHNFRWQWG